LSKAIAIIALTGLLVVGAAAAAILGRDSVPEAGAAMATASPAEEVPVANRQSKGDRLAVAVAAPASVEPAQTGAVPIEPLRQAFAATPPSEIEGLKIASPPAPQIASPAAPPAPPAPPKPKVAIKLPPQKPYALLSDAQIASIKERLKLSSNQESYWPAVEKALRAVARKIHATRQADPSGTAAIIDPESEEVQQLKSAAMPLLFQLREDQKREVRTLARLIGLEKVAEAI
jgi:hypothetical protein